MTHSDNAVRDSALALRAVQLGLWYRVGTVGTRFQQLLLLTLVWLPMDTMWQHTEALVHFSLCIILGNILRLGPKATEMV